MVYLFSAVAGTTYHFFLFRHFGISVFDYWEASDYLASAVREPMILLAAIIAVTIAAGVIWNREFDDWATEQGPLTRTFFGNLLWDKTGVNWLWKKLGIRLGNNPLLGIVLGALWFGVMAWILAVGAGNKIQEGRSGSVVVRPGPAGEPSMQAGLISRTSAFVLLVDPASGSSYVMPLESVSSIRICADRSAPDCQ
jgi:hypothetical protein